MDDSLSQPRALDDAGAHPGATLEGHQIAQSFAMFAARLQEAPGDPTELARLIVAGAVALIPGADQAALRRLAGRRHLDTPVATDHGLPYHLMELQNTFDEGPCLDAVLTRKQIQVSDMAAESRWPRYAPAAAALGVVAQLCTPMELRDHTTGCLALIGTSGGFDDEAASVAGIFAVHAGIALSGALRQESLNTALTSRGLIGQAKGILMERFRMTEEQAFTALVKISADKNVKLRAVCEELCSTGSFEVGAPPRKVAPDPPGAPVRR